MSTTQETQRKDLQVKLFNNYIVPKGKTIYTIIKLTKKGELSRSYTVKTICDLLDSGM